MIGNGYADTAADTAAVASPRTYSERPMREASPEEMRAKDPADKLATDYSTAYSSLRRIQAALELLQSANITSPDALLKSDLLNAAQHATALSRSIRKIKATIFPEVQKGADPAPLTTPDTEA